MKYKQYEKLLSDIANAKVRRQPMMRLSVIDADALICEFEYLKKKCEDLSSEVSNSNKPDAISTKKSNIFDGGRF